MSYVKAAQSAGFELELTARGRYIWVSPCGQKRGKERHATQDEAWEECYESNALANNNGA
jgi:hypothetical protein